MKRQARSILCFEQLETRATPANFFVSPLSLVVTDAAGNNAQDAANENAAKTSVGVDAAVFLNTNDRLIFDANFNRAFDAGDTVLAFIKAGQAMAFLEEDLNNGAFSIDEFEGLAVSDGFKGNVRAISADIVTTLKPDGTVAFASGTTLSVLDASILELNVVGDLDQLGAGGSISNVKITPAVGSDVLASGASAILTGTAAGGKNYFGRTSAAFFPANSATGGSITNVYAARGVETMIAGNGGNGAAQQAGGGGGSIVGVTFSAIPTGLEMVAGNGGNGNGGNGGEGGRIANAKVTANTSTGGIVITAGNGGNGSNNFSGGPGGGLSNIQLTVAQLHDQLQLDGGQGGNGLGTGGGGAGGSIVGATANVNFVPGIVRIRSGAGGVSGPTGPGGGTGGELRNLRFASIGLIEGAIEFAAGAGGQGSSSQPGGAGGRFVDSKIDIASASAGAVLEGGIGGGAGVNNVGGVGGELARVTLKVSRQVVGEFEIRGGQGGAAVGAGDGGAGGRLGQVSVLAAAIADLRVASGRGGNAQIAGDGGNGGLLEYVNVSIARAIAALSVQVQSGHGGSATGAGIGGNGGNASRATVIINNGNVEFASVESGSGGDSATGSAGNAGNIADSKVTIGKYAVADAAFIAAATGGDSVSGNGGLGGNVDRSIAINFGTSGFLFVGSGSGGDVDSGNGKGGNAGSVRSSFVKNFSAARFLQLGSGNGGEANGNGDGGRGGDVELSSAINTGALIFDGGLFVSTGDGGDAAGNGKGGAGGDIRQVSASSAPISASINFNSGDGGDGSVGGAGGLVDRPRFTSPKAIVAVESGDGGDGETRGGNGGAITGASGTAGYLFVQSGDGGEGVTVVGSDGGHGGLIENLTATVTFFAQSIISGSGGNGFGGANSIGGDGGLIHNIKILGRGDIGNFESAFGGETEEMGGLIAGLAGDATTDGQAGSIDGVQARRIAAIFAGNDDTNANELTTANAVKSIKNITANVIGADRNGNGTFDFTGAGGFGLGQGETAIDGLVIVKSGGFDDATINVDPLLVVQA
jgi:hypothetical protein